MKKYVIALLAILLICLAVCSCTYRENVWFDDEVLEKCLVPELPELDAPYASQDGEDVYAQLTGSERENYAQEVYEYLKSRNFKCLGARGEHYASPLNATFSYGIQIGRELSDFCSDGIYKFIFSDGTCDEDGNMIFSILTIAPTAQGKQALGKGFEKFYYNTIISLRRSDDRGYGEEYTWEGDDAHPTHTLDLNDTCIYCGYVLSYPDGIAQVIIDRDNFAKSRRDELMAEKPGHIAYYINTSYVRVSMYVFGDAEDVIEKYDLDELLSKAEVKFGDSYDKQIDHITAKFNRDDFTEEIYQKLLEIKNDESTTKSMYIECDHYAYTSIYLPVIDNYTDGASAVDYAAAAGKECTSTYGKPGKTRIIRSKSEYVEYLNELIGDVDEEYVMEKIEKEFNAYDDEFFKENDLIITSTLFSSDSGVSFSVDGVYIADGEVYVVVTTRDFGGGYTAISYCTFNITVRKSELDGIDTAVTLH